MEREFVQSRRLIPTGPGSRRKTVANAAFSLLLRTTGIAFELTPRHHELHQTFARKAGGQPAAPDKARISPRTLHGLSHRLP